MAFAESPFHHDDKTLTLAALDQCVSLRCTSALHML